MSKGLTPLEVSKELKDFVLEFVKNGLDRRFIQGSFDLIEKELKEKEELAQALSIVTCENGDLLKYKKALEIIKEKQVNYRTLLCIFNTSDNYKDYNKLFPRNKLTQEEYDLLREVLL